MKRFKQWPAVMKCPLYPRISWAWNYMLSRFKLFRGKDWRKWYVLSSVLLPNYKGLFINYTNITRASSDTHSVKSERIFYLITSHCIEMPVQLIQLLWNIIFYTKYILSDPIISCNNTIYSVTHLCLVYWFNIRKKATMCPRSSKLKLHFMYPIHLKWCGF